MSTAYEQSKGKERPQPNPNQRIKKWAWIELVKRDGSFCYKRENKIREYDVILRKWVEKPELTTVDYLTLEEMGVLKKQSLKVLVIREGIDPSTIRKLYGYFVVTLQAKIPNAPEYENIYLKIVKAEKHGRRRVAGCFVSSDLALGVSQILNFDHIWVKRLAGEKRVSAKQGQKLMDSGEVADIVSEDPDGNFSPRKIVFNRRL